MSISSEITRIAQAKSDLKTQIENKGATVGQGTIDTYPLAVSNIPSGTPYAPKSVSMMGYVGSIAEMQADFNAIDFSNCTKICSLVNNDALQNETQATVHGNFVIDIQTPNLTDLSDLFCITSSSGNSTPSYNLCFDNITFTHIDTGKVTVFSNFLARTKITSVDISCFTSDANTLVDARKMFANALNLTTINMGNWSPKIVNATNLMENSKAITSIDISNWDLTELSNCSYMFRQSTSTTGNSLTTIIGVDKLKVTKCDRFQWVFENCPAQLNIDWSSGFQCASTGLMSLYGMFKNSKIQTFKISDVAFNTSGSSSGFGEMFYNCKQLTSVEFQNTDSTRCGGFSSTFEGCTALTTVKIPTMNIRLGGTFSVQYMFRNCTHLTHLDIRSWEFSHMTSSMNPDKMFGYSSGVPQIPVDCEIIVKDATEKTALLGYYSTLTNVKTVAEYEGS